jgi:hypothetical protein
LAFETTRERIELKRPEGVLHRPDCPMPTPSSKLKVQSKP